MSGEAVFEVRDSFTISGRGTVYVGAWPFDCDRRDATYRLVKVNEDIFRVEGVEWFAIPREPRKGDTVGLALLKL